jgi:hypothetical protein
MDLVCSELTDLVYELKFTGIKKTLDYEGIVTKLKTDMAAPKEPPPEEKPDPKKKAPVPPKKPAEAVAAP